MRRALALVFVLGLVLQAGPSGAQEPEDGTISGTVTDGSGSPLGEICVYAEGAFRAWAWAETDVTGSYTMSVEPTDYKVSFYDCSEEPAYLAEYYDDQPDFDSADVVTVGEGESVTGIDAALEEGGSIEGTVSDEETGDPIDEACVNVSTYESESEGEVEVIGHSFAWTDASGSYRIGPLRSGDYAVWFGDCRWPQEYEGEYYDDAPDLESATTVTVEAPEETAGIDAALERVVPPPDLAVTALDVRNIPLRTDDGDVAGLSFRREIDVTIENLGGSAPSEPADLVVEVCPESTVNCRLIAWESVELDAGEQREYTFDWNGAGMIGDVTVRAAAMAMPDADHTNDVAEVEHFVLVGGTGVGAGV